MFSYRQLGFLLALSCCLLTGTLVRAQAQSFTTLYSFSTESSNYTNSDGARSDASLIQASDGNLYGTAAGGGANGNGTIFKITPAGTFTTLHNFGASSNTDGIDPLAVLMQASDGNLYGTTASGGAYGSGTLFKTSLSGAFTILYSFSTLSSASTNADGNWPSAALMQASDGNLYGTARYGGANGTGTLFKITTAGTFTSLYSFTALSSNGTNPDGAYPYDSLIQASDGKLYGTAGGSHTGGGVGGANGNGTIFAFDIGATTAPTLSSLNPGSVNAGGSAFTLTVKGTDFSSSDSVHWTQGTSTNALSTTYVSATQLKASVPASLIASPGKAAITVVTSSGVASNSKSLAIKVTTLKLVSASITKTNTGAYTATLTLKNIGYLSAQNVSLTNASLGPASTSTSLPVSLGSLAAGASTSTALSFPGSAGSSGTLVTLKVSGKFTGGTFSGSLKVTLP